MSDAAVKGSASTSRNGRDRRKTNPRAEWISVAELRDLVANYYGTKTLMFDRQLAETLLEYNTGNRKVNERRKGIIAQAMATGNFENTGEPLIISAEGILNSGQHRLMALLDADVELDMDVRFGIPRHVFALTDTGSPRTPKDMASIRRLQNGGDVATAVRILILYERGLPGSIREYVSNDEVNKGISRWMDIVDVIDRAKKHKLPRAIRGGPVYASIYLASLSPGKSKLDQWLEILATGLTTDKENPAYVLRERFMRGLEAPLGSREVLLERFALMNKSWNLFRSGQSIAKRDFKWRSTGDKPEPFPLVTGAKLPAAENPDGGV